jgi:flagellar biosynthesis protein FliR
MEILPNQVWAIGLVFARIGAFLMLAPGIGDTSVPARFRLGIALFVAASIAPLVASKLPAIPADNATLFRLIGVEIMIGLAIGFSTRAIYAALATAGAIVGLQTGLAFAMTMDPAQGTQDSVFASFLAMIGVVVLLESNVHHFFILGALNSYNQFAPNGIFPSGISADWLIESFSQSFQIAFQFTAPLIVFGIIYNVALGLINRAAPAIQVFFITQPIQILFGIFIFMLSVGAGISFWLDAITKAAKSLN